MTPEEQYRILFETGTEGLLIANEHGVIELANPRAEEMFGYDKGQLDGQNVDQLLPKHLRDNHQKSREGYVHHPRKRPMGAGYDLIGVRKDGSSFPIEISLNYHRSESGIKVHALIMDVTQRKEQEAQIKILNKDLEKRVNKRTKELKESQLLYSMIARNYPNGTINVFDQDLNYIFVEGQELYRYGITSEKLVGKNYLARLPKEVRPEMEERLKRVLQGENLDFELEYQDQYYMISTVGLRNEEGEISRILLVEQNISERKNAEEQTKTALQKEMQLNEMKSRFVSMASHEFRTPLSTVLSSLTLLEKYDAAGATDKKPKHYQRIRSSVRLLTGILNDFLSLEKVESGKVYVNRAEIDLHSALKDIVDQHNQVKKLDQELIFEYAGEEEAYVDQNMIRIIVSNLLSNAIKYSPEKKRIWFDVQVNNESIRMTFKDEGIGIPMEDQENMFQRFFRAKNATNIEGTGLGLNIVSKYLHILDGEISFISSPDEGTTFFVQMPNLLKDEEDIID